MKYRLVSFLLVCVAASLAVSPLRADNDDAKRDRTVHAVAVFPFQERGRDVEGLGGKATDLILAELVANPSMYLVEREDLKRLLSEHELSLSGLVKTSQKTQIGQLTGAKIIVAGSVFQIDEKIYLVAKIIGTETSRVIGASVKGAVDDSLDGLTDRLAAEIVHSIKKSSAALVAKRVKKSDRIAALQKKLGDAKRPTVWISVEERHVGRTAIDPAAETELTLFCKETGLVVIDSDKGSSQQAKYLIQGEAISEFATRHGNLASVKARLEVKVVERASGRMIAVDRQTCVAVDLVEQIAAKQALQNAAADIAERLLPKLVGSQRPN